MRLIVVGFGTVGRSLIDIVMHRSDWLRSSYRFTPEVVAIVDRGGAIINQV